MRLVLFSCWRFPQLCSAPFVESWVVCIERGVEHSPPVRARLEHLHRMCWGHHPSQWHPQPMGSPWTHNHYIVWGLAQQELWLGSVCHHLLAPAHSLLDTFGFCLQVVIRAIQWHGLYISLSCTTHTGRLARRLASLQVGLVGQVVFVDLWRRLELQASTGAATCAGMLFHVHHPGVGSLMAD